MDIIPNGHSHNQLNSHFNRQDCQEKFINITIFLNSVSTMLLCYMLPSDLRDICYIIEKNKFW